MFDFVFKATPGCFFTPGRVSIGQGELAVAGSGVADLKGLIDVYKRQVASLTDDNAVLAGIASAHYCDINATLY